MIIIRHVSNTVFQENTYIAIDSKKNALVIDPGDDPGVLIKRIDREKCRVRAVLATHAHVDHVLAAGPLCEHYKCPFIMNGRDGEWLKQLESMCHEFQLPWYGTPEIDIDIDGKETMETGGFSLRILHTPGHSEGSVCFLFDHTLFSGDTLFRHSVGRCDLPGGNEKALRRSVKEKLFPLPGGTKVYPGHMETTTIDEEKRNNPFVR